MGEAVRRWREALEDWAIPEEILERAPASPWSFPVEVFRDRAGAAREAAPTPSTARALEALPGGGTVLDVGVGGGAASVPLAPPASEIVGVDESRDLLETFEAVAREAGIRHRAIEGRWPEAARAAPEADVVVCHHVLYNVADLPPFVEALTEHARRRVVVELGAEHPMAWTRPLWWRFHRLPRPEGPTADDAVRALEELGIPVRREEHEPGDHPGGFGRRADAVAFVRTRLCLPAERDPEVEEALAGLLVERGGRWVVGSPHRRLVTLWWDPPGAGR
jgi:SAM-dependent methyltransferase